MTSHQLLRLKQVEKKNGTEAFSNLSIYEGRYLSPFNQDWSGQCGRARIGN